MAVKVPSSRAEWSLIRRAKDRTPSSLLPVATAVCVAHAPDGHLAKELTGTRTSSGACGLIRSNATKSEVHCKLMKRIFANSMWLSVHYF